MTAVGLGQQGSQAIGSRFESLPCQNFLRFISNIFRYPKIMKHQGFCYGFFRHCETKNFSTEKLDTTPRLIHKHFGYRKFFETQHRRVLLRNLLALRQKKNF